MGIIDNWDSDKNTALIRSRGVSFEVVVALLEAGEILDVLEHPNKEKYGHQQIYVIEINGYAYWVPFVKDKNNIFLKTIVPNRKAQKNI